MPTGQPPPADDPAALLRDWMTLAQTELAGLAADREVLETWQGLIAMWAQAAAPLHDRAAAAPWSAPAAAPSAAEQPALAALLARIDALEQRIATLERPAAAPAVRRARKPPGRKPAG